MHGNCVLVQTAGLREFIQREGVFDLLSFFALMYPVEFTLHPFGGPDLQVGEH